ncbi:MAG: hypothetical protein JF613_09575, partial [Acidobacteria bacterium]|nr:hypothetical protein [Acidobacteriota bacterium]
YDGSCEDLFFFIDRLLVRDCGEDATGRLHTARSRNDIDMTMYRMQQRVLILSLYEGAIRLRDVFLAQADANRDAVFAAHTHTQPAQPTTIAHYLHAVVEQLERDAVRLRAAYASTNKNPLGACAITGTGFAIDRQRTSDLLGFDGPTGNTYGSIATVDYLLESVSAAAVLLAGLGRVASCRRSEIRSHSNMRARSAARRSGRRAPSCSPSITRRSATSSIPRTTCSRSSSPCSTMPIARFGWLPLR